MSHHAQLPPGVRAFIEHAAEVSCDQFRKKTGLSDAVQLSTIVLPRNSHNNRVVQIVFTEMQKLGCWVGLYNPTATFEGGLDLDLLLLIAAGPPEAVSAGFMTIQGEAEDLNGRPLGGLR